MTRLPDYYEARNTWSPVETRDAVGAIASFMNMVYAWMCVGLATTAVVAWWVSSRADVMRSVFQPGTFIVLVLIELGLVVAVSYAINRINATVATLLFLIYSGLNGLTLSWVFVAYELATVGLAFAVTAGMFLVMSIIGFTTRANLASMGGWLLMGLVGLIIASIVNVFVASTALDWIVSYAGVAIFLGLTVYDTQRLAALALQTGGRGEMASRLAIVGSLMLYLDFVNLLLFILRILGRSKD